MGGPAKKKKGKQRAHAFEGDQGLGGGRPAIFATRESVDTVLLSLEGERAPNLLIERLK